MNILVFSSVFYPSIGGLENQTLTLVREFLRKGHNVKVIVIQFEEITSTSGEPELKDIEVDYCPGMLKKLKLFSWCDTIYIPNFSLKVIWFLYFGAFKKLIISHNDFYLSNKKNIITRIKLFLIKFASHNIAVSNAVSNYLNTKSNIIYNCYDNDIFKIYEEEERVYDFVFLGRLVSQKGCDLLIKACNSLKEPFTFNIIGDGPERPKLEKMVRDFGLEQNIKFLGILEDGHLARMLNRHKIMVVPSIGEEGFGMVVLEGMACGCRIIAADAGGLPEAVNRFGKTFRMCDQQELEFLLQTEMKDSKQDTNGVISEDLKNYLAIHKKEAVARQYLSLFE